MVEPAQSWSCHQLHCAIEHDRLVGNVVDSQCPIEVTMKCWSHSRVVRASYTDSTTQWLRLMQKRQSSVLKITVLGPTQNKNE